ncbi:MAG: DUF547 domain-containing protein [Ignavibacteriales bacterium]|nr:DUF547 domain-containing protein [Ignavibacteriales bacterium]
MSKTIRLAILLSLFLISRQTQAESHKLFTAILKDYVSDGWVNYKSLCMDNRMEQYLQQLADANPDTITSENARLAFWINAYNAYTLKVICDNYPVKSINDLHWGGLIIGTVLKKTIWDKDFVIINHKKTTLNSIEHEIIRTKFKEPRAHFALVCASKSCPPLRSEAYEAEKLDEQLNDQAKKFLADRTRNYFDVRRKNARISKIFSWFSEDFGKDDLSILLFSARFLPDDIAHAIKQEPDKWDIDYTDYDWSLNGE